MAEFEGAKMANRSSRLGALLATASCRGSDGLLPHGGAFKRKPTSSARSSHTGIGPQREGCSLYTPVCPSLQCLRGVLPDMSCDGLPN